MRRKRRKEGSDLFAGGPGEPKRITPIDIQQREFRLAFRGYHERDVDEFLDEVTEEVARLYADVKRFQEEFEARGTAGPDPDATSVLTYEAGAILDRAREEAARILAEAEAQADAIRAGASTGQAVAGMAPSAKAFLNTFIVRERDFLQNLAGLIQGHADSVKQDVRRVREATAAARAGGPESRESASRQDSASGQESARGEGSLESEGPGPPASGPEPPAERPEAAYLGDQGPDRPTEAWEVPEDSTGSPLQEPGQASRPGASVEKRSADVTIVDSGENVTVSYPPDVEESDRLAARTVEAPIGPGLVPRPVEDDEGQEGRSLRELFWGEE